MAHGNSPARPGKFLVLIFLSHVFFSQKLWHAEYKTTHLEMHKKYQLMLRRCPQYSSIL